MVQPESGPWRPQHQLKFLSELLLLSLIVSGAHKGWSWPRCWLVELRHQSDKVLKILPLCLSEEPWNTEAPFTSPRIASWIAWLALGGFRQICHHFVIFLQVRLTRVGPCYERCIWFCSKDDCLLLWVRLWGDISFCFLERSNITLQGEAFAFPLDFLLVTVVHC